MLHRLAVDLRPNIIPDQHLVLETPEPVLVELDGHSQVRAKLAGEGSVIPLLVQKDVKVGTQDGMERLALGASVNPVLVHEAVERRMHGGVSLLAELVPMMDDPAGLAGHARLRRLALVMIGVPLVAFVVVIAALVVVALIAAFVAAIRAGMSALAEAGFIVMGVVRRPATTVAIATIPRATGVFVVVGSHLARDARKCRGWR